MDIQAQFNGLATLGAAWVMWLLVTLSIIGLAVALERLVFFWVRRENVAALGDELYRFLRAGRTEEARQRLARSRSLEARIAEAGLSAPEEGVAAAEERMQGATQLVRLQMERRLAFLGTLGSNAPFVGLLGTVIGIVRAFQALDDAGGKVTAGLMAEIGEALVATAIGLLVALPAVALFNYFQRTIKARVARAEALSRQVLAHLKAEKV